MNQLKRIGGEEQNLDIMEDREEEGYKNIKQPDYTQNYVKKNEKF